MEKVHKTIIVTGIVQGVGFRYAVKHIAHSMGIKGTVCNMADGSVKIEAEGTSKQMDVFIKWCHKGPAHAQVNYVFVSDTPVKGYSHFDITLY